MSYNDHQLLTNLKTFNKMNFFKIQKMKTLKVLLVCIFCINISKSQNLKWLEGADGYLTKEEEQLFCDLAKEGKIDPLCENSRGETINCTRIGDKVGGTEPSCIAKNVCSFKIRNNTVHVTNRNCIDYYIYIRTCAHNMSIIIPTKENTCNEARDREDFDKTSGAKDKGIYETPNVKQMGLCTDGPEHKANVENCVSKLRDELLLNFHEEKRLGYLIGPHCKDIWEGTDKNKAEVLKRCSLHGIFYNETAKKYDKFIINAFNQKGAKEVCTMSYWGSSNIVEGPAAGEPTTHKP